MHLTTKDSDCQAQNARSWDRQPQTFFADRPVGDQGAFTTTTRPETRSADDSVDGKYHSTTGASFNYGHRVSTPSKASGRLSTRRRSAREERKTTHRLALSYRTSKPSTERLASKHQTFLHYPALVIPLNLATLLPVPTQPALIPPPPPSPTTVPFLPYLNIYRHQYSQTPNSPSLSSPTTSRPPNKNPRPSAPRLPSLPHSQTEGTRFPHYPLPFQSDGGSYSHNA
jgi:hypothetical protein